MTSHFFRSRETAWLAVGCILCPLALGADVVAPVPIATLPLVSGDEQNATVAFITEETIAVARYAPPAKGVFPGSIITVAWRDGNLKASAEEFFSFDTMALGGGLYGVSSGRILSKLTRTPWLLSGKLQKLEDLPSQIVPPEHQGSLVGSLQGFDHWKLYRLGPPLSLVREGPRRDSVRVGPGSSLPWGSRSARRDDRREPSGFLPIPAPFEMRRESGNTCTRSVTRNRLRLRSYYRLSR